MRDEEDLKHVNRVVNMILWAACVALIVGLILVVKERTRLFQMLGVCVETCFGVKLTE